MIFKSLITVLALVTLAGCASNFTSINHAEKDGSYYLTEITAGFPVVSSDLYKCEANSNTRMTCEEID